MKLYVIACQVFNRDICYLASQSDNSITVRTLPQGLHNTPELLRKYLQREIDTIEADSQSGALRHPPDAILFCYGLCCNGLAGLKAKSIPLVIPKTDDCIAVFLGSQKRYLRHFRQDGGTFWLNNGWMETAYLPLEDQLEQRRKHYTELYGEENAGFLIAEENRWIENYSSLIYIDSDIYHCEEHRRNARRLAEQSGWNFRSLRGDSSMIKRLLGGEWDEQEFLVCPPGSITAEDFEGRKLRYILP